MTTQSNTARTAEAAPSLRERAGRLRDAAGRFVRRKPAEPAPPAPEAGPVAAAAAPVLVAQVSEWSALQAYMTNTFPMENEDLDEKLGRANELHELICAFEARNLAEMAAKLPIYEDEHAEVKRFEDGTLVERTWNSFIRDLKAVSSQPTSASQADPILAAIAETRRLTIARTNALAVDLPAGTIDPTPEQNAATDAFFAHVDDVLLKTVPATVVGCVALARYAGEFLEAEGFCLDENRSNDQHVRILDLIARSPLLDGPLPEASAETDFTLEGAAALSFEPCTFEGPACPPSRWKEKLSGYALSMVLAEQVLRMGKAEIEAFIAEVGEEDATAPEALLHNLDATQATLEGWAKLLSVASARYTIAASSAIVGLSPGAEG